MLVLFTEELYTNLKDDKIYNFSIKKFSGQKDTEGISFALNFQKRDKSIEIFISKHIPQERIPEELKSFPRHPEL